MNKIEFKTPVNVETWSTHFYNVSKIVINKVDVCIDIYNSSNQLIGSIYYCKHNAEDVWVEDYENDNTILLVENGVVANDFR